ncbi:Fur family transcriptional regulator [Phenylobacterium soli]|uniref:Transcriptional repressor n=1 Tax=Phenylobacterium soli TaxID=2170551 RepID=A0A328AKM9_9CAUL|nr:Fur family transcriptional regulator [Phenylobacterium soli]RAK54945.1 transcriptional repressor [Phenylobacterium soli]
MTPARCPHQTPDARPCPLAERLDVARSRCERDGERWTEPRRRTYQLLVEAGRPVKAYDLIAAYKAPGQVAPPPTVYRALEFLLARGLVHRIESRNAFVACEHPETDHAPEFLICECCGRTEELRNDLNRVVREQARARGYVVRTATVELTGLCPACRAS